MDVFKSYCQNAKYLIGKHYAAVRFIQRGVVYSDYVADTYEEGTQEQQKSAQAQLLLAGVDTDGFSIYLRLIHSKYLRYEVNGCLYLVWATHEAVCVQDDSATPYNFQPLKFQVNQLLQTAMRREVRIIGGDNLLAAAFPNVEAINYLLNSGVRLANPFFLAEEWSDDVDRAISVFIAAGYKITDDDRLFISFHIPYSEWNDLDAISEKHFEQLCQKYYKVPANFDSVESVSDVDGFLLLMFARGLRVDRVNRPLKPFTLSRLIESL